VGFTVGGHGLDRRIVVGGGSDAYSKCIDSAALSFLSIQLWGGLQEGWYLGPLRRCFQRLEQQKKSVGLPINQKPISVEIYGESLTLAITFQADFLLVVPIRQDQLQIPHRKSQKVDHHINAAASHALFGEMSDIRCDGFFNGSDDADFFEAKAEMTAEKKQTPAISQILPVCFEPEHFALGL